MFRSIWKWLNGNKTIIGLLLSKFIEISTIRLFLGSYYDFVEVLIYAFTGYGIINHAKKGFFTTRKGD